CEKQLKPTNRNCVGHWHYAHFYYAQVKYREGESTWDGYYKKIRKRLLDEASVIEIGDATVSMWKEGFIGPVYTTSLNLIILQLEKAYLPIYQR
ncbi:MAG: hypothetical protein MKZ95_11845, partial [Pirellulales bacterium]|nr:hypothetical protein [Pirellulales bacterium]